MRMAVCQLPAGAGLTVQGEDLGRTFRSGDRVDLDAVAVPARGDRPAATWGELLGHHAAECFTLDRVDAAAKGTAAGGGRRPAKE